MATVEGMAIFKHEPHPYVEQHKKSKPPLTTDERIGLNGRIGAAVTKAVGTMTAVYVASLIMAAWMVLSSLKIITFDPYPYPFLLFLGNIVQLLLMFVIMVGQQVLGAASDKRAVQTYQDAEAILHESMQIQLHLAAQDDAIERMLADITHLRNSLLEQVEQSKVESGPSVSPDPESSGKP
ncbi:MAG: DUF1003 domain-containing protein [Acidimicrobiaceae bacterium]|nr:DUF1003 domain-containing protein [Acidimicrobiaceae bacterium]